MGVESNSIQYGLDQLTRLWGWSPTPLVWFGPADRLSLGGADHLHSLAGLAPLPGGTSLLPGLFFPTSDSSSAAPDKVLLFILTLVLLRLLSSCRRWFMLDGWRDNPYKLPVNRSAFTCCEDEIPAGLDLAKAKYGGPCTTEEVEDVKAFYSIIKTIRVSSPIV